MSKVSHTEVFDCPVEKFYDIVSDYENYSEFLSEVKACRVLETQGSRKLVEYQINIIKNFSYSLWMDEDKPNSIKWEFAGGDLFKVSNGGWTLVDEAGKTRATYELEAKFKTFVPGPIAKALVSVNLPGMMSSYHKRVSELYGG
jgi:ribosome-associated toxin RatA of RatAB toxin-antitoxin module